MRFRDYLSFKDLVKQTCQDWDLDVDQEIEGSPLFKKGRIEANPKGYYLKIKKSVNQKELDSKTRKYYEQCINRRSQYSNETIESLIKTINHPNIKIVRFSGTLKIDSVKSDVLFTPRSFYFTEEYTIYFDDLSYLAIKSLAR